MSIKKRIREMEIGASESFSVADVKGNTLANYASIMGFEMERKYAVNIDRKNRAYIVTRVS